MKEKAKAVFNKAKNMVKTIAKRITAAIKKIDVMKTVKKLLNKFFKLTASCKFQKYFFAICKKI